MLRTAGSRPHSHTVDYSRAGRRPHRGRHLYECHSGTRHLPTESAGAPYEGRHAPRAHSCSFPRRPDGRGVPRPSRGRRAPVRGIYGSMVCAVQAVRFSPRGAAAQRRHTHAPDTAPPPWSKSEMSAEWSSEFLSVCRTGYMYCVPHLQVTLLLKLQRCMEFCDSQSRTEGILVAFSTSQRYPP